MSFSLSYGTLVLIAASCYMAVCMPIEAQPTQSTKKLDLANRISISSGVAAAAAAAGTEARQKRAMGEYKELNDIIDELEENSLGQKGQTPTPQSQQQQEFDLDNMPPLTYYLLLQKLRQLQGVSEPAYRVRTPRLGRSIDFQQLWDSSRTNRMDEDEGATAGGGGGSSGGISRQFVSRMMKKSVPFKPRLGKRAQVCAGGNGD